MLKLILFLLPLFAPLVVSSTTYAESSCEQQSYVLLGRIDGYHYESVFLLISDKDLKKIGVFSLNIYDHLLDPLDLDKIVKNRFHFSLDVAKILFGDLITDENYGLR